MSLALISLAGYSRYAQLDAGGAWSDYRTAKSKTLRRAYDNSCTQECCVARDHSAWTSCCWAVPSSRTDLWLAGHGPPLLRQPRRRRHAVVMAILTMISLAVILFQL
jgi:hypothetical protein